MRSATPWQPPGPALLFCPGDRPDRLGQAVERADMVIVDLEDAIPERRKDTARQMVVDALDDGLDPSRVIVRVNEFDSPWGDADLRSLAASPARFIMVPKAEDTAERVDASRWRVIALIETPLGVVRAADVAATPGCVALAWGGQDLAASLGAPALDERGRLHPTGSHARTEVLFAAAAHGLPAIDTVRTRIDDDQGLAEEAGQAARAGFAGKLVIHPRQVDTVREAFLPTDHDVQQARRILDASVDGVGTLDGEMLDPPVIARARAVLRRAGEHEPQRGSGA